MGQSDRLSAPDVYALFLLVGKATSPSLPPRRQRSDGQERYAAHTVILISWALLIPPPAVGPSAGRCGNPKLGPNLDGNNQNSLGKTSTFPR
jgi:hypothetical protein